MGKMSASSAAVAPKLDIFTNEEVMVVEPNEKIYDHGKCRNDTLGDLEGKNFDVENETQ